MKKFKLSLEYCISYSESIKPGIINDSLFFSIIRFLDNDMITHTLHNVKWKIKNWDKIDVEVLWNAIPIKEHNTDITWAIEKSGNYK